LRRRLRQVVHQQPGRQGQGGKVARHQLNLALRPAVQQRDGFELADAVRQFKGALRHHAHAQAVVDHAAHGVQAGHVDAQLDGAAQPRRGLAHGQVNRAVGMQADLVVIQRGFKADGALRAQRVAPGNDEHQFVGAVGQHLQVARAVGGVADAQVGRAFLHGAHDLCAQVLFQVYLDAGMLARESAQVFRQKLHDGRDAGMHAHVAAHAVGIFAELALHFFEAEQHRARVVQQAFAGGRQVDAAGVAVQQRRVQRGFEVGERLLTAEAAMNSRSAALPMLPSSHTATKS
jgi:hypothetical protein